MKVTAVLAEFNPLHNGHEYFLKAAREKTGADRILVLMSGNYVQRGLPAVCERSVRCIWALKAGADAVLEMPARFVLASADKYAESAVNLFNALGCVDSMAFGSESGSLGRLEEAAGCLLAKDEESEAVLRRSLRKGLTYAEAVAAAYPSCSDVLGNANDLLAVDYLKALLSSGSSIKPYTVKRLGGTPSASAIRKELADGHPEAAAGQMPEDVCGSLLRLTEENALLQPSSFTEILAMRLTDAGTPEDLEQYLNVSRDLARTVFRMRGSCTDFSAFAATVKPRSLTYTHVSRALLSAALGLVKDPELSDMSYVQVTGYRRESEDLIRLIASSSDVPVIIRPASDTGRLSPAAARLFREETRVTDLYRSLLAIQKGTPAKGSLSDRLITI